MSMNRLPRNVSLSTQNLANKQPGVELHGWLNSPGLLALHQGKADHQDQQHRIKKSREYYITFNIYCSTAFSLVT